MIFSSKISIKFRDKTHQKYQNFNIFLMVFENFQKFLRGLLLRQWQDISRYGAVQSSTSRIRSELWVEKYIIGWDWRYYQYFPRYRILQLYSESNIQSLKKIKKIFHFYFLNLSKKIESKNFKKENSKFWKKFGRSNQSV